MAVLSIATAAETTNIGPPTTPPPGHPASQPANDRPIISRYICNTAATGTAVRRLAAAMSNTAFY